MRDLIKGRGFIMLSQNGPVQVLRVKAYMYGTTRLVGVCEGRYSLSRLGDGHNYSLLNHFFMSALYFLPVLNGNLPLGMLDRDNTGVSPYGIGPGCIPYGIKGGWEGPLQGNYVLDCSGRARGSHLG